MEESWPRGIFSLSVSFPLLPKSSTVPVNTQKTINMTPNMANLIPLVNTVFLKKRGGIFHEVKENLCYTFTFPKHLRMISIKWSQPVASKLHSMQIKLLILSMTYKLLHRREQEIILRVYEQSSLSIFIKLNSSHKLKLWQKSQTNFYFIQFHTFNYFSHPF